MSVIDEIAAAACEAAGIVLKDDLFGENALSKKLGAFCVIGGRKAVFSEKILSANGKISAAEGEYSAKIKLFGKICGYADGGELSQKAEAFAEAAAFGMSGGAEVSIGEIVRNAVLSRLECDIELKARSLMTRDES